jgi:predicted CxxxxCH...CXXCH cytochrome family protein
VVGLTDCIRCHDQTVTSSGAIVINAGLHVNGLVETNVMDNGCASCHGTLSRGAGGAPATFFEAAPPASVPGSPGAGVHVQHVNSPRSKSVECEECHLGSTAFEVFSPNPNSAWLHADDVVDLRFGPLASQGGAAPAYTLGSGGSCAATYCHGNFTGGAGASNVTPTWLTTGVLGCTACHGNPPALPHPQNDGCAGCHGTGYSKTGNTTGTVIQVAHVDGTTTGQTFGCTSCHGVINTASPGATAGDPVLAAPGVAGGVAVTTTLAPSVTVSQYGLHSVHLTQNNFTGAAIACGNCHQVPVDGNTAHGSGTGGTGGAASTLSFSLLAQGNVAARVSPVATSSKGGAASTASAVGTAPGGATTNAWSTPANPTYVRGTGCATVYCHGEFRNGQLGKTIAWTANAAMTCNSCHGTPGPNPATQPGGGHPASSTCGSCHQGYTGTTVNVATHLNGKLEYSGGTACSDCHGDSTRTAMTAGTLGPAQTLNNLLGMPPKDTQGVTAGGVRTGAHQSHAVPLVPSQQIYKTVACSECHGIAVNTYPLGHSNGTTELTFASSITANFGNVAAAIVQNAAPTPDTCTTYCHGASLTAQQKGSVTQWQWTSTASATCGSCHGASPADAVHTSVSKSAAATACNPCHNTVVNTSGGIIFSGSGTSATTLHMNGSRQATTTCQSCHGSGTNFAPPVATSGTTAVTNPKVGAHQKHLTGTTLRTGALACDNCHTVPAAQNHATGAVNVTWNTLASLGAGGTFTLAPAAPTVAASWESTPTCTNYCHGGKWAAVPTSRGNQYQPNWTLGATQAACNSCHLAPPASSGHSSYVATTNCQSCHPGYNCFGNSLATCQVNKSVHINGIGADGVVMSCALCHGDATRTAMVAGTFGAAQSANNLLGMPPKDTQGATAGGVRTGAHQSHAVPLVPSQQIYKTVACSECHGVVVNSYTGAHSNGATDLTFASSVTANLGNVAASIVQNTAPTPDTCTTYCHGASLTAQQKGSATQWQWTSTASATCGSCHGASPADAVHTSVSKSAAATACNPCHNTVVNTSGGIIFSGSGTSATTLHMNGSRQATVACNSCHGGALNAAPPVATAGSSAVTNPKVGAHQRHLTGSALRVSALACGDCHTVPVSMTHASGAVNVTWNTLASSGAGYTLAPATGTIAAGWESTPTCTNYCHGGKWAANATYRGNTNQPTWTSSGVATQCNDCHLAPPGSSNHASVLGSTTKNCGDCHTGYTCTTGNLAACTVNKAVHINGAFDAPTLSCTSCHGSVTNAAPPLATNGASTGSKVGAHQKHVTGTTLRTATLACGECHTVPGSTSHSNATVELPWATLAKTGSITPTPANLTGAALTTWEATPTCTNYCHGGKWAAVPTSRGNQYQPNWNSGATQAACNSCHLAPPGTSGHGSVTSSTNCQTCHTGYNCFGNSLATCQVNKSVHINGTTNAPTSCDSCHGTTGRTMTAGTFGPAQVSANLIIGVPPKDTDGNSTGALVGAHVSHTVPTTPAQQIFRPVLCSECHGIVVNSYVGAHTNGTTELTFASSPSAGLGNVAAAINQNAFPTPDTCTTYCHGASLTAQQKGSATQWQWTSTTSATCGSCHGASPADPVHTTVSKSAAATACNPCHNTVVNTSGGIIFNGSGTSATTLHINGSRQATTTCQSCHGSGTNFAPPAATSGSTATTNPKVGAHQKHLTGTTLRTSSLACDNCHTVPGAQNHASGAVNMTWNTLASTGSGFTLAPAAGALAASWESTPTCTNYCHGGKWAAVPASRGNQYQPNWTLGATQAACNSCHLAPPGSSGHATVTATVNCNGCHPGYLCTGNSLATCQVNKSVHINGSLQVNASCTSCHGAAITTGTVPRRAITPEFGYAWSHKRSASPVGTVAAGDCGVCHMEGDTAGNMNGTYHGNGVINLRDPDTGGHIKQVSWGGTGAGTYTANGTDATFVTFGRNLSSNALEASVQAIMINQCLKCHDANGAASTLAQVTGGSAAKPFGTTIGSTTNYTGNGITALGTPGGVADVNASFATSNASYHPVRGKQNNSYVSGTRLTAPWTGITKTAGTTTSWGYLISCWDCHAPTGASGLQTLTVTAHGGTVTLRRSVYISSTTDNLCRLCHVTNNAAGNHGTGSAFSGGGDSAMTSRMDAGCYMCHGSKTGSATSGTANRPVRPFPAQDAHGFNAFQVGMGTDTMWPLGASDTYRPWGFMRNVGTSGAWRTTTVNWRPNSGPGLTAGTASCGGNPGGSTCSNGMGTYTPGGVY